MIWLPYGSHFFYFKIAYGHTSVTDQAILKALTVYMLTIISADSKYDQMRQGKIAFNTKESAGYKLFKANCAACHTEPLFTNGSYQNNGLDSVFNDLGRGRITLIEEDNGKFKVPTLRNVEFTYPYMHDGRFWTLDQVIEHYSQGVQHSSTLNPLLHEPMQFTSAQKEQLIAFLYTLSDFSLLNNPLHYE